MSTLDEMLMGLDGMADQTPAIDSFEFLRANKTGALAIVVDGLHPVAEGARMRFRGHEIDIETTTGRPLIIRGVMPGDEGHCRRAPSLCLMMVAPNGAPQMRDLSLA